MNDDIKREYLIFFKQNIVNLNDQNIYEKIDLYFDRSEFIKDIDFLERNNLITDNERTLTYLITTKGEKYLEQLIKEHLYNSEKERIEFEKSKIDLELSKKMLKEYPYTKWLARIGAFMGIGLAVLEVIKWLIKLE